MLIQLAEQAGLLSGGDMLFHGLPLPTCVQALPSLSRASAPSASAAHMERIASGLSSDEDTRGSLMLAPS
jgi:hypothetical protein